MRQRLWPLLLCAALAASACAQVRRPAARPLRQKVVRRIETGVPAIIQKVVDASRLTYAGTRTVQFGNGVKAKTHVEIVLHDGDRTRIEFPVGSPLGGQIIVEDSRQRQQYFPKRNEIELLPPRNDVTFVRLAAFVKRAIKQGWTIGDSPGDRIAGVNTELTYLQDPKGVVRHRLWVDPATGMILRRAIYDVNGDIQAAFEFSQIDYSPSVRAADFVIDRPGARIVTPEMIANEMAAKIGLEPALLSASSGYRLDSSRVVKVGAGRALSMLYSGPSGKLSLFILKGGVNSQRLGDFAKGRYRVYSWLRNGQTLALVGELDESRLQQIAGQVTKG